MLEAAPLPTSKAVLPTENFVGAQLAEGTAFRCLGQRNPFDAWNFPRHDHPLHFIMTLKLSRVDLAAKDTDVLLGPPT